MNTPALFSAHQDVLQAPIPATAPEQERLWQELKNRAKGAVGSGQWPDALHLYNKALEVVDAAIETQGNSTGTSNKSSTFNTCQEQAVLRSNLSLVHSKMHDWDAAVESARQAVAADAAYVKAWWRLAQAQAGVKNPAGAIHALEQGLALEPDNKAFQKEMEKMRQMQAGNAEAAFAAVVQNRTKTVAPSASPTTAPAPTATTKAAAAAAPSQSQSKAQPDAKGDTTKTKSSSDDMKGYKIVNGKKTSYFHNELSGEAAALIGDIAPKKLDTGAAATAGASSTDNTSSNVEKATSAWNKAGTWEERDVTAWAIPSLQEQLTVTTYQLPASSPAPGATVTVTSAVVKGTASVATVRGKKRFLYEFSVVVDWKVCTTDHPILASGSLTFPDIDGTCVLGEPYDCTDFVVRHMDDVTIRPVLDAFVYRAGLREALHESIDAWVRLFQETY
jgi:tetratricopeptide (TPR) repeat protein